MSVRECCKLTNERADPEEKARLALQLCMRDEIEILIYILGRQSEITRKILNWLESSNFKVAERFTYGCQGRALKLLEALRVPDFSCRNRI